jgi:hypothetical protein
LGLFAKWLVCVIESVQNYWWLAVGLPGRKRGLFERLTLDAGGLISLLIGPPGAGKSMLRKLAGVNQKLAGKSGSQTG